LPARRLFVPFFVRPDERPRRDGTRRTARRRRQQRAARRGAARRAANLHGECSRRSFGRRAGCNYRGLAFESRSPDVSDVPMCVLRTRMRAIDPTVARAIRMASSCVSLWIDVDPRSSRISLTSLARYRYVILLQLADVEAFCTCVGRMCLPPNSSLVPSSSRSSHTYLTRNTISSIAIIFKG